MAAAIDMDFSVFVWYEVMKLKKRKSICLEQIFGVIVDRDISKGTRIKFDGKTRQFRSFSASTVLRSTTMPVTLTWHYVLMISSSCHSKAFMVFVCL